MRRAIRDQHIHISRKKLKKLLIQNTKSNSFHTSLRGVEEEEEEDSKEIIEV